METQLAMKTDKKAAQVAYRVALAARTRSELDAARESAYPTGIKRCAKCSETKPLGDFREDKRSTTAIVSYCRGCEAVRRCGFAQKNALRSGEEILEARTRLRPNGRKFCSDCSTEHGFAAFHKSRINGDGLAPICKDCQSVRMSKLYQDNTEEMRAKSRVRHAVVSSENLAMSRAECAAAARTAYPSGTKTCSLCDTERPLAAFGRDNTKRSTVRSRCRSCERDEHREYVRSANPRWFTESRIRWIAANREKVTKRAIEAHYFKKAIGWDSLVAAMEKKCSYCGEIKPLEVDHMMPHSRGGEQDALNATPACRSCNATKNAKTPLEWFTQLLDNDEPLPARCA